MDHGQIAVAEVKRASVDSEYAAEVERMKAEVAENKKRKPKPEVEIVPLQKTKPRDKRAGTNASYIDDAGRVVERRLDLAKQVEKGVKGKKGGLSEYARALGRWRWKA